MNQTCVFLTVSFPLFSSILTKDEGEKSFFLHSVSWNPSQIWALPTVDSYSQEGSDAWKGCLEQRLDRIRE